MIDEDYEKEIDLGKLILRILKKWKFIFLSVCIFTLAFLLCTIIFVPKKYTTSMTMYVNNGQAATSSVNIGDISASRSLVNSYISLLKSDCVLDRIEKNLNNPKYDTDTLREAIYCEQVNETEIFKISITTVDPMLSMEIANHMKKIAPEEISRVFKFGSAQLVDDAITPKHPSSPNVIKNAVLGGILGGFVSGITILIFALFDQKINDPSDYENIYSIPLIGTIPDRSEKQY